MIASLRGRVAAVDLRAVVLDTGAVGLSVLCTPGTLADLRVGQEATLSTTLVVREESLTLYGFADDDERDTFELLQTASGVGPKVALAMLAVHAPATLHAAIAAGDTVTLTRVPGIGPKGAQRIVLELKDKVGALATAASAAAPAPPAAESSDNALVQALVGLGWSAKEASRAVDEVTKDLDPDAPVDVAGLLRAALRTLARA